MKDQVTLKSAEDYGRRCTSIGKERRNTADLQDAMDHPEFKARHHALLDQLVAEQRQRIKPLIERPASLIVRVGMLKTVADLRQAVTNAGCQITPWADDMINRPAFKVGIVQAEEDIEFIFASNAELGYPNGCTRARTYEAGLKLGWKLCFPSDAIEIRRQYLEQPKNEWLYVAMDAITTSDGLFRVFSVTPDDTSPLLGADDAYSGILRRGDCCWAFRRK